MPQPAVPNPEKSDDQPKQTSVPSISSPKGGGALRSIGEKFNVSSATGTASFSIPLSVSSGRAGFDPELQLSYDSGSGNGIFGWGWSLSLPSITRKTDKGLPRYSDSDVFLISNAEDLVPVLTEANQQWKRPTIPVQTVGNATFEVRRYRPRMEGLFARIERWTNTKTGETHWRSVSRDNITTLYGATSNSRIADPATPANPARVYSWLICQSYDDRGNVIQYEYAEEDDAGVDADAAYEANRDSTARSANRYIKRVLYGNTPSRLTQPDPAQMRWHFELVFDYGEHDADQPLPDDDGAWLCRHDPFSTYRPGFEVRTYRLCQRVLMFHHFPGEPFVRENCLVRSMEFHYSGDSQRGRSSATMLEAVTSVGHRRLADAPDSAYLSQPLPPLEFSYSEAVIHEAVQVIDAAQLENLPQGLGGDYQWVDLDGEGLSGILTRQGGDFYYKPNLGGGRFGALRPVRAQPSAAGLEDKRQLLDLEGDGRLDMVTFSAPVPGFFERTPNENWEAFVPFASLPQLQWDDPDIRFTDLTGDGFADILKIEANRFTWYPSLGERGFGEAQFSAQALNTPRSPRFLAADERHSLYLADMSGDGLPDLVQIGNGEVSYLPNLGYGRFGTRVVMENAPCFDHDSLFEVSRLRLADIDGTGVTDLIYLGGDGVQLYFNQSGNGWSGERRLAQFPAIDDTINVDVIDLLGNGTSCLVWSSPLPNDARQPLRYIDLMGGNKPHLLVRIINNLGAETRIHYVSSTQFYLADKAAGTPWLTRLTFPVHVVERQETLDRIGRNWFVTRYAYHHGYFDGREREFRGFGMVEQWDTEARELLDTVSEFALNLDPASNIPPVLTRTWFHTGAAPDVIWQGGELTHQYLREYYREGDASEEFSGLTDAQLDAMLLEDTILPRDLRQANGQRAPYRLTPDEELEAYRALKGSILRQEVYALDQSDAQDRPYRVSERSYIVDLLQPKQENAHAVFLTHARETVDFQYERVLYRNGNQYRADPRVSHAITIDIDAYGNVLQSVAVAYGRRFLDSTLPAEDQQVQARTLITYTETDYTKPVEANGWRTPQPCDTRTYELLNVTPKASQPQVTNLFRLEDLRRAIAEASDDEHTLSYVETQGENAAEPYRRLIEHVRTLYRADDLSGALEFGTMGTRALIYQTYKLAFTPELLAALYTRERNGVPENLITDAAALLGAEGAYALSGDLKTAQLFPATDADDCWWVQGSTVYYSPDAAHSAAQEWAYAQTHFFLPCRFRDPFGSTTTVLYDPYDLLPLETRDPLGNCVTAGIRAPDNTLQENGNDYRVLQPEWVMDANRNRNRAAFDARGMVVGTAVMGKPEENEGDTLEGFVADLDEASITACLENPLADPQALLGRATSRIIYDAFAYYRTRDQDAAQPTSACTLTRETHDAELAPGAQPRIQCQLSYSDGFGREAQKKAQAEPGALEEGGAEVRPRWVGSGWTIYNNKGKPVRQYEPFFTATHAFEFAAIRGVSLILFYDPLERVIGTLHPHHAYEKVVFDCWSESKWDLNDTAALEDPKGDAQLGDFFRRLPASAYAPTWYSQRSGGALGTEAQEAAAQTLIHAETPTITHVDALGRTFLSTTHNRFERDGARVNEYASTRTQLDIEGNLRAVTDALERVIVTQAFDMLGNKMRIHSVDAGETITLLDAGGKTIRSWDSRDYCLRTTYDALRRPTHVYVRQGTQPEKLAERTIYGEALTNAEVLNLRTRYYQHFDGAGVVISEDTDFKGNLRQTRRRLARNYKDDFDWAALDGLTDAQVIANPPDALLETGNGYLTVTAYDALNRPLTITAPENSAVIRPAYNEANLLERLDVRLRGAADWTPFVTDIDYDEKAQRKWIAYGNGVQTEYTYDRQTFRLTHLQTTRPEADFPGDCPEPARCGVQNLHYTYDPSGNITALRDDAQQDVFFQNQHVEPHNRYLYDALYRLIDAYGREHIGQVGNCQPYHRPERHPHYDWSDCGRIRQAHPHDGTALRRYHESYSYDKVGNLKTLRHAANGDVWVRHYEPAADSNRLMTTSLPGDGDNPPYGASYSYDAHGNMTSMPHLPLMRWDYQDQLQATAQQVVNNGGTPETTYYVYDANGQRVRKVTERQAAANQTPTRRKERIYLGVFEIYREYGGDGTTIALERETLHIMDDKRRIALIETRTQGSDPAPAQFTRYQFSNHLDSAALELDGSGQVISYEEYFPYGSTSYQAVRSQTETPKRYRYTGKERDEENGLYYHGARYYAPWLGRWTSVDPSGLIDGINIYAYVRNNPIMLSDPTGHLSWGQWAGIAAAVAVGTVVTVATAGLAGPVVGTAAAAIIGGIVGGAAGGAAGEIIEAKIDNRAITAGNVGRAALIGGVAGGVFSGAGAFVSAAARGGGGAAGALARSAAGYVANSGAGQALKSGVSSIAKSGLGQGLRKGVERAADSAIGRGVSAVGSRISAGLKAVEKASERAGQSITSAIGRKSATSSANAVGTQEVTASGNSLTRRFARVGGQETVPASAQEAATFRQSVSMRKELSESVVGDKVVKLQGDRLSVGIKGGSEVKSTLHTHPTSKVAMFSEGDIQAFRAGGYADDTVHSVLGDKWPHARRELVYQGLEPPPLDVVKTSINQSMVRSDNILIETLRLKPQ